MHAVPAMCLNHQVPQHQGGDKKQELSRDKHMTWITAKMEFSTYHLPEMFVRCFTSEEKHQRFCGQSDSPPK